jgi:hypothetical protein
MRDSTALIPNSVLEPHKPLATAKGMQFNITLAEPVVFLEGYNKDDPSTKKCSILRGQLHLKVIEATKIKRIWIRFRGQIEIQWPKGMFSIMERLGIRFVSLIRFSFAPE